MAKELLLKKKLSIGQLRPLIGHKDADQYLQIILKNKMNSRDIEKLIKKGNVKKHKIKTKSADITNLEKELSDITGLKIDINFDSSNQKGNLNIKCKNLSEFNYVIEKIKT